MMSRHKCIADFRLLPPLMLAGIATASVAALAATAIGQRREHPAASATRPGETVRSASIHWENVPLRHAVERLAGAFQMAIFVDRRLDPMQRIRLKMDSATLDDVAAELAEVNNWETCRIGGVVYLGLAGQAEVLRAVAAARHDEIQALSAFERRSLESRVPTHWRRLASPRELVETSIRLRNWRVRGEEKIPHDLWQAGHLPPLSLADQLSLLLVGFDLSFRVHPEQRTIEIFPVDERLIAGRADRAPQGASDKHRAGASAAAHQMATELLPDRLNRRSPSSSRKQQVKQVYTLRVEEQPVGDMLRRLAERLDWQLQIDEEAIRSAGLSLDRRVSFAVQNADEDELLEALLSPAELTHRHDGAHLKIVPKPAAVNRD